MVSEGEAEAASRSRNFAFQQVDASPLQPCWPKHSTVARRLRQAGARPKRSGGMPPAVMVWLETLLIEGFSGQTLPR